MDQSAPGNGDATANLRRKREKRRFWEMSQYGSSDGGAVQNDRRSTGSTSLGPRLHDIQA